MAIAILVLLLLVGLVIFLFPQEFARGVAGILSRLPQSIQAAYRSVSLGRSYDSPFWVAYYRYASGALVLLVAALWLLLRRFGAV